MKRKAMMAVCAAMMLFVGNVVSAEEAAPAEEVTAEAVPEEKGPAEEGPEGPAGEGPMGEMPGGPGQEEDDGSERGFVCLVTQECEIYWEKGVETFEDLMEINGLTEEDNIAKVWMYPNNGEAYPYLYPEGEWEMRFFEDQTPEWFGEDQEAIIETAFEEWKSEVYNFDYEAVRNLTADDTINAAPGEGYEVSEEDISAFLQYIYLENSLCTYIKTSVNDTIVVETGAAVASDVWNYVNRDVGETAKHVPDVGSMLRDMGVSNVGVVQNDFTGAVTGRYFDVDEWLYYGEETEGYPYECAVYLWDHGLTISEDSDGIWRLHSAADGEIYYEIANEEVTSSNAFACVADSEGNVYWQQSLDDCDTIRTAFALAEDGDYAEIQVKPVVNEETAELVLPDGNNTDVLRYFPYLDATAEWTVVVRNETPEWYGEETEAAVLEAFEQWKEELYGTFDFEAATQIFTEDTKNVSDYTDEDIELMKEWAIAWHELKDQKVNPTAMIKGIGYENVGSSLWLELDAYLLSAWRAQHAACPGDVAQAGYFAAQGITDSQQYDHTIGDIVGDSVSDVMEALAGTFFSNIEEWQTEDGEYIYAAAAELLSRGLVPYTDGTDWYLCSGENCEIVYQISEKELLG